MSAFCLILNWESKNESSMLLRSKTHRGNKAPILNDADKDNSYSEQQPSMRVVVKFFFLKEKQKTPTNLLST